jgi:hypothetical protein
MQIQAPGASRIVQMTRQATEGWAGESKEAWEKKGAQLDGAADAMTREDPAQNDRGTYGYGFGQHHY